MTFGVNALDWTNIGRKLRTSMAETVGESLVATNLAAFSSMIGFIIYDGETGVKTTQYDMYIDRDEDEEELDLSSLLRSENEEKNKESQLCSNRRARNSASSAAFFSSACPRQTKRASIASSSSPSPVSLAFLQ